ncbi:HlyD family efflux transporter periplasmic adaptor subunit [Phormidium sp. CCY1219]|uniref:HlyD family efflux transporter periplasmic adaptor subunit n=1 Tax=Phormidium sp. CCY1219 TaxID=2886104 RepID=UPI002D1E8799|nr:HlyD family efflux transporter periplasmic adaptor subunit [Phormidium sp. CCY1219]MEB3831062.1 HlyD family efflux transporter periplasmic adaptor subunit [Phormidium sp. CCY1219]
MKFKIRANNSKTKTGKGWKEEKSPRQGGRLQFENLSREEEETEICDRPSGIYGGIASSASSPPSIPDGSHNEKNEEPRDREAEAEESNWSPSVHSLLEKPPAAFGRYVLLGGMVFSVVFGTWAWLGRINEVGQAPGELVPQGDTYQVNPVEMGKVAKIAVEEGETVEKGAVIAELDTKLAEAEVKRLQEQLANSQLQLVQKQDSIEQIRLEAQTRVAMAQADAEAQEAAIARAQENVGTTTEMLAQLQEQQAALQARRDRLQPLAQQAQELVEQLRADVAAQQERSEIAEPLQEKTEELIAQLESDVQAQQQRQEIVAPLQEKSQQLIEQLKVDIEAQKERIGRLKPLVDEGAVSKERLFQAEQALRDRENALLRAQMSDKTRAREQMFEARQAMRDRQNALVRAQISETTRAKERLFEAGQALRDRQTALLRSQISEATRVKERLFEAERSLRNQREKMTETRGQLEEAKAELTRLQAQLKQKRAEAERIELESQQQIDRLQVEISELEGRITDTKNRLESARTKLEERFLYAPVDGVVLSLALSNTGEVVKPGETIAEIAAEDAPLVLSASVPNREAGFMETGMEVQVKFDAYPYQEYGIVSGKVTSISPDTKANDRLGEVYKVEVTLDRNYVMDNGKKIYFKPGQTAQADIVIRKRRIADLFLDPIRQLKEGGINF